MWKEHTQRDSFRCAWQGVAAVYGQERHFRFHCLFSVVVLLLCVLFQISLLEWLFIVSAIVLVLGAELINTAIETLADMVTTDYHPMAKLAKDIGAGLVVLCCIYAVVIGGIIFVPKLWGMLFG